MRQQPALQLGNPGAKRRHDSLDLGQGEARGDVLRARANRPGSAVSQGVRDQFWLWSMQAGLKGAYDCIRVFSETDLTEDLKRFDIPTLFIHGEDD